MFQRRIPLFAGDTANIVATFTTDTLINNLWVYFGEPSGDQNVDITVDGCDIGDVIITSDWGSGSTFTFTCINGGRICGLGGDGGDGGDDFGATGERGFKGNDGSPAITCSGFAVDVDIDDGYLLGGGGGGGGGAYEDTGVGGNPGCGGGGGAGFSVTAGGNAGAFTGLPQSADGGDGGPAGPGLGGIGTIDDTINGGDGGNWGAGGKSGNASNALATGGFGPYTAGVGGAAGNAFSPSSGATINFTGSKSETTLRTENRLLGQLGSIPRLLEFRSFIASRSGTSTHGWSFQSDGVLVLVDSVGGGTDITGHWYPTSPVSNPGIGANYEIRNRNNTDSEDAAGWDSTPGAQGTFFALSSTRAWTITSGSGIESGGGLMEIRAVNQPAGDILVSGYISITDENGV
jgi:hypothetical protein